MNRSVQTDAAGWPVGLPQAEQDALRSRVRDILATHDDFGTHDIVRFLKDRRYWDIPTWNTAVVQDWIYEAVDRAARDVAYSVWRLEKRERPDSFELEVIRNRIGGAK